MAYQVRDLDFTWQADAACRGIDTALFFPERGEPTAEVKAVCRACPVREACLTYALDAREKWGLWGGSSERQRRRMRKGTGRGRRAAS